jgi:hypothetical protein
VPLIVGVALLTEQDGREHRRRSSQHARTLTTTVFSQRSTRRFEASPRRAAPKGHNSFISRTASLAFEEKASYEVSGRDQEDERK